MRDLLHLSLQRMRHGLLIFREILGMLLSLAIPPVFYKSLELLVVWIELCRTMEILVAARLDSVRLELSVNLLFVQECLVIHIFN